MHKIKECVGGSTFFRLKKGNLSKEKLCWVGKENLNWEK